MLKIVKTIFKFWMRMKNFFLHLRNIMNLFFVLCTQEVMKYKQMLVAYPHCFPISGLTVAACLETSGFLACNFSVLSVFHYYITCAERYNCHVLSPFCGIWWPYQLSTRQKTHTSKPEGTGQILEQWICFIHYCMCLYLCMFSMCNDVSSTLCHTHTCSLFLLHINTLWYSRST